MPLSVSTQVSPIGSILIQQTDSNEVADNNITGAPATVLMVDVDNTANAAEDAYVKFYNDLAPNVGTTDPDWILLIPQGVRRQIVITEGLEFSTGLSVATVTTPGTPGVLPLGSAVVIRMICL